MDQLPSGAVTFLFTDIEGSTAAWEENPEKMAASVELHDRLIKSAVESNNGFVFATGGDSFSAAFNSPSSALTAAASAQRELNASEVAPAVRMAVLTGEAVERDGNYYGPPLNRTARLMSLGHGGQVLVAPTTRALTEGDDFSFLDMGEHRLADLAGPIRVYQLELDGLDVSFPPLRSVVATSNLPLLGQVFGRDSDIEQLAADLAENRLVTLVGAGGIGKTTLAIATASRLLRQYDDGCWLVGLTSLPPGSDAGSVAAAVATVDHRFSELATLAPRQMLMIFDNCEHVVDGVSAYLEELLKAAPQVTALATSRERLGAAGESVMAIQSLVTGRGSDRADAVDLFVARAKEAGGTVVIDRDREAIEEICEAVGGLPLAIELAAGRTAVMSIAEIKNRLSDRLAILKGGTGGPAHHETIEAAIAWSYDLVEPDAQQLLRRLSVFEGGFDLDMTESVESNADGSSRAAIDTLGDLVRKSLIHRREGRFEMIESVRQFAQRRLDDLEEDEAAQLHHFAYFAAWADVRQAHLVRVGMTPEDRRWVTANSANLRSAIKWGANHNRLNQAADISWALWVGYRGDQWFEASYEHQDWFEPLLPHLEELEPEHQVGLLHQWGVVQYLAGNFRKAAELYQREHERYVRWGRPRRGIAVLNNLGVVAQDEGRWDDAKQWYQEAIIEHKDLGLDHSGPLGNLSEVIFYVEGRLQDALDLLWDYDPPPVPVSEYGPHWLPLRRAELLIEQGNLEEAREQANGALTGVRSIGLPGRGSEALIALANIESESNKERAAVALLLEALEYVGPSWRGPRTYSSWLSLARILIRLRRPQVARRVLGTGMNRGNAIPPMVQTALDQLTTELEAAQSHQKRDRTHPSRPLADLITEVLHTHLHTS